jgi:hypothetical protein
MASNVSIEICDDENDRDHIIDTMVAAEITRNKYFANDNPEIVLPYEDFPSLFERT